MFHFPNVLAFHDCVGPDGCDGCLNTDDSDNNGLADIVDRLTDVKAGNRRVPAFDVSCHGVVSCIS